MKSNLILCMSLKKHIYPGIWGAGMRRHWKAALLQYWSRSTGSTACGWVYNDVKQLSCSGHGSNAICSNHPLYSPLSIFSHSFQNPFHGVLLHEWDSFLLLLNVLNNLFFLFPFFDLRQQVPFDNPP